MVPKWVARRLESMRRRNARSAEVDREWALFMDEGAQTPKKGLAPRAAAKRVADLRDAAAHLRGEAKRFEKRAQKR